MNRRSVSIASALLAMRKLGVDTVIDFSVKCRLPDFMLEHTMQASLLIGQDRWILHLPPVQAREGTVPILDEMTVIRQTETEPVLGPEDSDEHISESLPETCDPEDFEPEEDLLHVESILRQKYVEGRENGGLEDLPFGWPV
jgi:hypothetical protein